MDSTASARPFPFLALPPELRNMIYRLVIVTGQCLSIRNMHLCEFKKSQYSGAYQSRSTYVAMDHQCDVQAEPGRWLADMIPSCLVKDKRFGPCMKTTYTLDKPQSIHTTTTAMLSLNKESRKEAASIFYGENAFYFAAMSSLVPFMKDRTVEARQYIRVLGLDLKVDHRDWYAILAENSRPASWNTAFSSLAELHLNIKQLNIRIDDSRSEILRDGLNLRSRSMLWLHKLSKLDNLEMLGVRYGVAQWKLDGRLGQCDTFEEEKSQTEQELWRFLAPKMLKKEADDHTPDALQNRRIWDSSDDFVCAHTTFTDLRLLGDFGSDSDSDDE